MVVAVLATLHEFSRVVERGKDLLPYPADVIKVRVADAVTLYVDVQPQPPADVVNGMMLAGGAMAALMAALILRWVAEPRRELIVFYALASAALGYLALDELAAVHETLGHNLAFLADLPGITGPDTVVQAAYLVPAAFFTLRFRAVLAEYGRARDLFMLTAGTYLSAEAVDLFQLPGEEVLELTATLVGIAALGLVIEAHLKRALPKGATTQPS